MDTRFIELNRLMKQLYSVNRQWFAVRARFAGLPEAEQRELFALMVTMIEPLAELRRKLAEMEQAAEVAGAQ